MSQDGNLRISRVRPDTVRPALELLLSSSDNPLQVDDLVGAVARGQLNLSGLFQAEQDGLLRGVAWAQVLPGKTGYVWPVQTAPSAPGETVARLLAAVDSFFQPHAVSMAQMLLSTEFDRDLQPEIDAGYQPQSDLLFMISPLDGVKEPAATNLRFEPFQDDQMQRLKRVIEATYADTLDLPVLNDVRHLDDVIEGYQNTGDYTPERWFFVCDAGRDVGCLLLTEHTAGDQCELMYMGLVPSSRGRGWGDQIVDHALWVASQSTSSRLVLAVDSENRPAVAMYQRCGFEPLDRRRVLIRIARPATRP